MTLIVEFELCMYRTHGSSFLPSWVPATELRLSAFTHSASNQPLRMLFPCMYMLYSAHIHASPATFSYLSFLLLRFPECSLVHWLMVLLSGYRRYDAVLLMAEEDSTAHTHTPFLYWLIAGSSLDCCEQWHYEQLCEQAALCTDSSSSYGSGVVYITRSKW